jgi:hypothetical protein
MNADVKIGSLSAVYPVSVEKAFLAVAKHVKDGLYKLVSVNASAYSFVVVCEVQVSADEFEAAWVNKFAKESEF